MNIFMRLLTLSVMVVLVACTTPAVPNPPTTAASVAQSATDCRLIEHMAGATEVCGEPQRVVALSPHMLDILLSLGGQPMGYAEVEGVGVGAEFGEPTTQIKYIGSRVTSRPINVGTRANPSLETLVQLDPDLILYEQAEADEVYDTLAQIAPTLAFVGPRHNDWQTSIVPIAAALGHPERAQAVIEAHNARLAEAKAALAPIVTDRQFMLLAIAGVDEGVVNVSSLTSFARGTLSDLGLQFYQLSDKFNTENEASGLSLESLAQTDPDSIIVMASSDNTPERAAQEWADTPVLSNLRAYREGRVYFVDYQLWSRIRGPLAAELLVEEMRAILLQEQPDATSATPENNTASDTLFPLKITDAAGQEFTFDAPLKIGCAWTGCHEFMADLGLNPHASWTWLENGYASPLYFPFGPPTHDIVDVDNPEAWAAAEVDVIINRLPVDPGDDAFKLAAPVFYLHFPSAGPPSLPGYQAYLENLRLLGQLTGHPAAAATAITRVETLLATLRSLATPETEQQTVAALFADEAYRAIGHANPFCAIIGEVGLGHCIESGWWDEINSEAFLALDPDWIAYMGGDYTGRTDPVWAQLTAVKAGRVYTTTSQRYDCCGTRLLVHALQDYVSHLLPDAGIPNPGPEEAFDPLQSPLLQGQ